LTIQIGARKFVCVSENVLTYRFSNSELTGGLSGTQDHLCAPARITLNPGREGSTP
jgi:hypothetical protein